MNKKIIEEAFYEIINEKTSDPTNPENMFDNSPEDD